MVHGNADIWSRFEKDSPEVAILDGPQGVGKFTGASMVATNLTGLESIMRLQRTTVKDVRDLITWFRYQSDEPKIAILEPGACHPNVWVLLKALMEDLPPNAHVWIVDSYTHPAPKGIRDQGFYYFFHALTVEEMSSFLEEAGTILLDPEYVTTLGSADRVMEMNVALQHKPSVANWIKAVEESNRDLLLIATGAWDHRHTTLLVAELEAQLAGTTLLSGTMFRRVGRTKVQQILTALQDGKDPCITAVASALLSMPH